MFSWFAFLAGLFLGMLLFFLLVCLTYSTRTVIFTNCPRETPYCMDEDYINDPQEAHTKGYRDNLMVVNDKLYFERPKRRTCVHHLDRPALISRPMFCSVNAREYKHLQGDAYSATDNGEVLYLGENCGYGTPLAKWE